MHPNRTVGSSPEASVFQHPRCGAQHATAMACHRSPAPSLGVMAPNDEVSMREEAARMHQIVLTTGAFAGGLVRLAALQHRRAIDDAASV